MHWSAPTHVGHNGIYALACPSAQLCVAGSADGLLVSTDPAGGASAWNLVFVPPTSGHEAPQVTSVSCPATSFCAATTLNGDVLTSSDPSGGTSAWQLSGVRLPAGSFPNIHTPAVSCVSASLCVAVALGARAVFSSTDPTGGVAAWTSIALGHPLQALTCTAPRLCLLGDDHGDIRASNNPTGGSGAWSSAHIFGAPGSVDEIDALACASSTYCVASAVYGFGDVLISATRPTGTTPRTPGVWQDQVVETRNYSVFESGSCVAGGFCAFAASDGGVYFPTRSFRTQTHTRVDHPSRPNEGGGSISCVSKHWCALGAPGGNIYFGTSG